VGASLALLAVPAVWLFTPAGRWLVDSAAWAEQAGWAGALGFVLVYVASGVLLVPASWGMAWAGFVYGPVWGSLIAWGATIASAAVNLVLARTVLREVVRRRLGAGPWTVVDRLITVRGWPLIAWLRASPLSPFHPISFGLGATEVPLGQAMIGTAVGNLPSVLTWVWVGASLPALGRIFDEGLGSVSAVWWLSMAMTLLATAAVTRIARQELRAVLATQATEG
jgi:uncharacterized membrane protein YdjX (TVP38/TMEM64 family)